MPRTSRLVRTPWRTRRPPPRVDIPIAGSLLSSAMNEIAQAIANRQSEIDRLQARQVVLSARLVDPRGRRGSEAMCGAVGLFSPRRCPPDGQRLPRGNTAENFPMKPKPSVATTRPTPSFTPKRLPRRCPSSTSIVTYLSRSNSVRITVVVPSTTLQVTSECLELPRPIPTSISTSPTNRRNRNMVSMCRGSSRSPLLIKYTRTETPARLLIQPVPPIASAGVVLRNAAPPCTSARDRESA